MFTKIRLQIVVLLSVILLSNLLPSYAHEPSVMPDIQWQQTFGGSGADKMTGVVKYNYSTSNLGFVVVGETQSTDGDITSSFGKTDVFVEKYGQSDALNWKKFIGSSQEDHANGVIAGPTQNQGFYVFGSTNGNDGQGAATKGGIDAWVVKLDNNGNVLWKKCFGARAMTFSLVVHLQMPQMVVLF